jgi:hypothetical protein
MGLRTFAFLPLLMMAACSQAVNPHAAAHPSPEKIAQGKIVALFADHADIFKCQSFRYVDKTIIATGVHIYPHPSITQDHPSATLSVKQLKITLAEDPAADRDLRLVAVNVDEPTLQRPASLRGSTEPTEVETFLAGYLTEMLNKVSTSQWTTLCNLQPEMATTANQAAAPTPQPFPDLREVNIHLLRIEMPPEKSGEAPDALVLSAQFVKADTAGWQATLQAGHQTADGAPELAPALHVQFKTEDAHLLVRSPDLGVPENATAVDR